jgi:hypothetical protein
LQAQGGSCEIVGAQGVAIRSGAKVSIASQAFGLCTSEASLIVQKMKAVTGTLSARFNAVEVISDSFDSICGCLSQVVERCYRKVEQLDQLRAGRLDYRTEHEATLRGEHLVFGARKLVKADGEQIHIG